MTIRTNTKSLYVSDSFMVYRFHYQDVDVSKDILFRLMCILNHVRYYVIIICVNNSRIIHVEIYYTTEYIISTVIGRFHYRQISIKIHKVLSSIVFYSSITYIIRNTSLSRLLQTLHIRYSK